MRNFNHSLSGGDGHLIIFAEASGMIEPGDGAFHPPSPREYFQLMGLDLLWNINVKINLFLQIRNEFFLHQFHVLHWLLPFSHSGNQWLRSLDSPFIWHLFASFSQDAPGFYPTDHWFGRGDKNCVLLIMAENRGATVAIYTPNPPNTGQYPPIPVCPTCSCTSRW